MWLVTLRLAVTAGFARIQRLLFLGAILAGLGLAVRLPPRFYRKLGSSMNFKEMLEDTMFLFCISLLELKIFGSREDCSLLAAVATLNSLSPVSFVVL